jgi:hypothetical protein
VTLDVLAQIRAHEAAIAELRWWKARAARVVTDARCATAGELTGAPFQRVRAAVRA